MIACIIDIQTVVATAPVTPHSALTAATPPTPLVASPTRARDSLPVCGPAVVGTAAVAAGLTVMAKFE